MHENYSSIINIENKGIDPGFSKGLSLDRGESLKRGIWWVQPLKATYKVIHKYRNKIIHMHDFQHIQLPVDQMRNTDGVW